MNNKSRPWFFVVLLVLCSLHLAWAYDPFNPKGFSHKIRKGESAHTLYPALKLKVSIARVHDNKALDIPFGKYEGGAKVVSTSPEGSTVVETPTRRETHADEHGYTKTVRELLAYHLSSIRCFQLIERQDIDAIVRELEFGQTKYVNRNKTPSIDMPDVIAKGFVMANNGSCKQDDEEKREVWGLKKEKSENDRLCLLRFYSTDTSHVKLVACGTGETPEDAIKEAVEEVNKRVDLLLPTVRALRVTAEHIDLDGGRDQGLVPGTEFYLVRMGGAKEHIDYDALEYVARCRVTTADAGSSSAAVERTFGSAVPGKGDMVFYWYPKRGW